MAYTSLARQYRPQRFEDVHGQQHVARTLQNAIRLDRTGQAYLFCGPRGVGKTTVARILAKALNCAQGPTPEPCGTCESCVSIVNGSSFAVIEIDAASNRTIEDIRALREDVEFKPVDGRTKIYILDEAHQIGRDAREAFLKTLEEPPPYVVFVLATTDPQKLPATILSRCQRFDFRRIGVEDIVARLGEVVARERLDVDSAALYTVASLADGSLRDALTLLDQIVAFAGGRATAADVESVLGILDVEKRFALGDVLAAQDVGATLAWVNQLLDAGRDPQLLVDEALRHFRLLLLARLGCAPETLRALPSEVRARLERQAGAFTPPRLMRIIEGWAACDKALRWHTQPRILLEVTLIGLALDQAPAPAGLATHLPPVPRPAAERAVSSSPPPPAPPPPPPPPARRDPEPLPEPERDLDAEPEPEPELEPELPTPPLGRTEELDLLAVRDRLPRFFERLRASRPPLASHVLHASVERLDGDEIVMGFHGWENSLGICSKPVNKQIIEETWAQVLGRPVRFRGELLPEQPAQRAAESFETMDSATRLDHAERTAKEIFPGARRADDID